jgi:hypothetical protein
MRIALLFECSGIVRRAFASRGHFVVSVDRKPAEDGAPWGQPNSPIGQHYIGDVFDFLSMGDTGEMPGQWDAIIAHPPCTYLCSSGLHWNGRRAGRQELTERALVDVARIMVQPVKRIVVENPRGCIGTRLKPAQWGFSWQTVQPNEFGDDASKATVLYVKGWPLLTKDPAQRVAGRIVEWPKGSGRMVERWANQTDSGPNRLGPSESRAADRARTYPGIARAMAEQWGGDFRLSH